MGTLVLAFAAGALSTLSPCVLPILPIVLAGATAESRLGLPALVAGLALSFAGLGLFLATAGFALGIDPRLFRYASALLLLGFGTVLLIPQLQTQFAALATPVGNLVQARFGGRPTEGAAGQFGLGLILGAVWSPCAGPTLGAASTLAARGENFGEVAMTMLLFGSGAGVPLLALGMLSRQRLLEWRGRLAKGGNASKAILGGALFAIGFAVLTGIDKQLEAVLVDLSPDWLTALTTAL